MLLKKIAFSPRYREKAILSTVFILLPINEQVRDFA
jgi:hypothetical protein